MPREKEIPSEESNQLFHSVDTISEENEGNAFVYKGAPLLDFGKYRSALKRSQIINYWAQHEPLTN